MLLYKKVTFFFLVLVFSMGYFITAISLGKPVADDGLQPSFFPLILGFASIVFSATLLSREIYLLRLAELKQRAELVSAGEASVESFKLPAFLIIVSIFIYIIAFSMIGYFISSIFFVYSIIMIFSEKEKLVQKFIISLIIVGLGYLVFEQMFGVRLPALWG